jgi:hypothetical protein
MLPHTGNLRRGPIRRAFLIRIAVSHIHLGADSLSFFSLPITGLVLYVGQR